MTDLKKQFESAAEEALTLSERPDNETKLLMYALYKQSTVGDASGEKPGFFDFVGVAKFEAWEKLQGTSKKDAMQKYVALIKKLNG